MGLHENGELGTEPQKLNIAMLSVHSCPAGTLGSKDTGGMNVYIRELARELGQMGHTVDIYTRAHQPGHAKVAELGNHARLIHLQAGDVDNVHKLVVYSYLADFACGLENFRQRNDLHYDVIHSHYWLSGWVGRRVQDWWRLPHITMFHTLGAAKNAVGIGEDDPELRIQTETELAGSCQRIIAATENEKSFLIKEYDAPPPAVSVVPCGVDLNLFRPVDRQAARQRLGLNGGGIALFVGRLEPLKGIDNLLSAMACLEGKRDVRLLIVGGDDDSQSEMERLKQMAQELQIQESVTFAGMIRQEQLPYYYSAADVCVIPSYYESFGLVALESMACGTPVVATRVGGVESFVRDGVNGYLLEDNSPVRLADKIAESLSGPARNRRTVSLARESVSGFRWSNVAQAVEKEYMAVIESFRSQGSAVQ